MADFEDRLRARLYRATCPSSLELGEYHLNLVSPSRKLVIAQHLRTCPHCTREVAQLEDFLRILAPDREEGLFGRARVIIARLVGPAGQPAFAPAVAALRGEGKAPLTLDADGFVIVLDVQPTPQGRISILGQIAGDDQDLWTGAQVELLQDGQLQSSTTIDDLGAFRCEDATPGSKELRIISRSESIIVVANFELSA